jgi:hypothetical protein
MRSRWFAGARAADGGLLLPGRPTRHAADLLLRPDEVVVTYRDEQATLPWTPGPSRWSISAFCERRSAPVGVALAVADPVSKDIVSLAARTRTLRNRLLLLFEAPRTAIPLRARTRDLPPDRRERDTLTALCALLRDRPALRARLGERTRVEALAGRLAEDPLADHTGIAAARRRRFEVQNALLAMGFTHPHGGRPYPGDVRIGADELVERVRHRLAANPHAAGLDFDDELIREVVHRSYLDVPPWPMEPLTLD